MWGGGWFRKLSLLYLWIASTTTTTIMAMASARNNNNNNPNDNDDDDNNENDDDDRPLPPPPNIVLVVIDDLGSNDLGWHGSGIETPTIDGLLSSSSSSSSASGNGGGGAVWLENYYVLPYCSPTRAALLTGRYPLHTGCHDVIKSMSTDGLPLEEETLPQLLRRQRRRGDSGNNNNNNYRTHAIGKWHLGHSSWSQTPTFRGFQSFFGYYLGWSDYYTHYTGCDQGLGYDLHWDDREFCGADCSQYPDERGNYSTHVFTHRAVQVIDNHYREQQQQQQQQGNNSSSSSSGNPLFLYLAYQGVHAPNEVPLFYSDRYRHRRDWSDERRLYAGMLTAVDEGIGNVTAALRRAGSMWDNTVLIITTDNGGPTDVCSVQGSTNRRRGGKCTVWEGGTVGDALIYGLQNHHFHKRRKTKNTSTRTAAAAPPVDNNNNNNSSSNHNTAPPGKTPLTYPHLFHVVDWFPTLARLAQVVPAGTKPLDGIDQLDGLLGLVTTSTDDNDVPPILRQEVFIGYAAMDGNWYGPAVRWHHWKLLQGETGGGPEDRRFIPPGPASPAPGGDPTSTYRLYNVDDDPYETIDLASTYPVLVQILRARLQEYQTTYVPPISPDGDHCDNGGSFAGLVKHHEYGQVWQPWCHKLVVYT